MSASPGHFLALFRVELQDLMEDIRVFEEELVLRFSKAEITSYVFQENDAFLRRELDSLSNFLNVVDGIAPDDYKDTGALSSFLIRSLQEQVDCCGSPEAVLRLVSRKISKLHEYLQTGGAH